MNEPIHCSQRQTACDREVEVVLLKDVREYMRRRLKRIAPDAVLTRAWGRFYPIYATLLTRFAAACGVPTDQIDDLVQRVWAEVMVRLLDFHSAENRARGLRAWLFKLVKSRAYDVMRRERRHPTQPLRPEDAERNLTSPEDDPATQMDQQWEHELVQTLMAYVRENESEIDGRILTMHYDEAKTVPAIAKELGMTSNAVYARQKRMLKKLHDRIRECYPQYFADKSGQSSRRSRPVGKKAKKS